jgi:glycosyltransferase involved in cell wall biosynthesis
MRILVVIYEFPPVGGGGGQVARDICHGLVKSGHEVRVLTAHLDDLPRQEQIDGFQVTRISSWRRQAYEADLLAMAGFVISGSIAGLREIRRWQPDLIHVHFAVPSGPVAWVLSRYSKIPYVLTAHLGDVPGGVPEKTKNWFRWFYPFTPQIWRDASHAIAVSEYTRQLALKHYPVDIQVIPNGVDLNRLDPGEIKVGNPPQIIFAGRFVPQKNPLQVVKILADLQDLPWNCVMLGDGVLRKEVEREVRKHNLQERIILTGWLTPDKVIQWFAKSDLLYMPSISEGLPVVGVQGLAMGLAIVASPVGGFVELVSDGENGYLIQPDQPDKTKESLRGLLSDPSLLHEYRINSRQKSVRYDLNKIVNSYNQLFTELASGYTKTV